MKIFVDKVEKIKDGNTNGRSWTLYKVYDADGKTYTTFLTNINEFVGKEIDVEIDTGEFVNSLGKLIKTEKITKIIQKESDDLLYLLNEINHKCDKILDKLYKLDF